MNKFLALKPVWALGVYIILDTICVGMGTGVPIFCILFGFPVGWLVLIIFISPPVQFPVTVFGS